MTPTSQTMTLRGLDHHVLTWAPPIDVDASGLTVLLIHGFADAGGSFDLVAPLLARAGHLVVAPDMRGFGETSWVGAGGYYHFMDYVADVDAIVRRLGVPNLAVVGHSMGGTISTLFSGARPNLVRKLALLEGFGPPDNEVKYSPDRCTKWLEDMSRDDGRPQTKSFPSTGEALRRLAQQHPHVPRDVLATRMPHLVKSLPDGSIAWRFDPMHRTTSPQSFYADNYRSFASRVTCPVLAVGGGPTGFHPSDESDRIASFPDVRVRNLDDAGHMMHWTKPNELARELLDFFA